MYASRRPAPISLRGYKSLAIMDIRDIYNRAYQACKHTDICADIEVFQELLRKSIARMGREMGLLFVRSELHDCSDIPDELTEYEIKSHLYSILRSIIREGAFEPDEIYITSPGDLWFCWRTYRK